MLAVLARRAARVLAVCLLVALAAPLAWKAVTGDFYLTVNGRSMMPTYQVGDVLVVQRPSGNELAVPGQIVVMTFDAERGDDGAMYVHRVLEPLGDAGAWLQGDGNDDRDPRPVQQDAVVGTPRLELHGTTARVFAFTQSLLGRVVLGAVALGLLLIPAPGRRATPDPQPASDHASPSIPTGRRT